MGNERIFPRLDITKIIERFGGSKGLHANLTAAGFVRVKEGQLNLAHSTPRTWISRGMVSGDWIIPIVLLLQHEGDELSAFLLYEEQTNTDPSENPFEGAAI